MADPEIVQKNLENMLSEDRGGMRYFLNRESINGNAGNNLAAANFLYNPETGEIERFSKRAEGATFSLAVDLDRHPNPFYKVVQCMYLIEPSETAKENLLASAKAYNAIEGDKAALEPAGIYSRITATAKNLLGKFRKYLSRGNS